MASKDDKAFKYRQEISQTSTPMKGREEQSFVRWRSHFDRDGGGCLMSHLVGCLEMTLAIFEQCTEPLADNTSDAESETITKKPKYPRRSRAKAAVAARVQRQSMELFQSAFDQVRGIVVNSGFKSILDLPFGEEKKKRVTRPAPNKPAFILPQRLNNQGPYGWSDRLTNVSRKMMYVSGETAEPSIETTSMIEDIVRQQVIELLRNCTELAARRGSRAITINDLIFQIRHDQAKVSRLRTFLSWKDVRKNVKDSDDKGGEADLGAGEDPSGGVVPGGPVDDATKKNKKAKVGLPWEPSSFYSQEVPERDDEEDEEEEEMNFITLQRLRKADERTKAMTKEEYVTWSEYRQASFTYRKGKRFREWAGFGIVTDSKPSDDIVDILGFLTFEMVQTLTEHALKVKEQEDLFKAQSGGENAGSKKRKVATGLFDPPSEGRSPIEPRHVQEAFRRLQQRPKKTRAMLNGTRLPQHTALNITKLKVQLKLAIARLRMVQQRDDSMGKTQRRAMAQLLEVGKIDSARIRVENIIRSDITTELHEILELYCELLIARAGLLEGSVCDPGLEEAVKSIIYAAPKTEIKELQVVRTLLAEKYGKEFVLAAMDNSDGKVSDKVVKKLSVTPPREELVQGYLEEIAKAYNVDWPKRPLADEPLDLLDDDDDDNPSGGIGVRIPEGPLGNSSKVAKEQEELSKATPPRTIGGPSSPLTVTPPRMTTDNVHPKVTLNSLELKPNKKMDAAAQKKPAGKGPGGNVPDITELERRFQALKR
ncbi:Transcription initiation protein spt3 [Colletotrichum fioriniae]|uniref:Transcription initiation protein spt3 n=1 Tax=Colletotrichum fioriniae TaxID=710243 RepID=UPI0032DB43E3|nr:Transcription initiation protein spt3 [Colletotrichum fioriniae]